MLNSTQSRSKRSQLENKLLSDIFYIALIEVN